MVIFDIVKIMVIAGLCAVSSYTDCTRGKISNRLTLPVAIVAVLLDCISYIAIDKSLLICFIVNSIAVICISITFYALKIWAGGDCKLLCAIALLFPVGLYWSDELSTPTLWLIVGISFSVSFFYLIIESIRSAKTIGSISWGRINAKFIHAAIHYLQTNLIVTTVSYVYQLLIAPFFQIPSMVYTALCICFISFIQDVQFLYTRSMSVGLLVLNSVAFLATKNTVQVSDLYIYLIVLVLMIVRIFMDQYNYKTINTVDIKAGMILSRPSSILFEKSRIKGLPGISDETLGSRLSVEEAASIIRWKDSKYGLDSLVIVRKIPFAIFISIGTFLYLILRVVVFC